MNSPAIDLAAMGFQPGDAVRLERLGLFDNGPQAEIFGSLLGVFSSTNVLLPGSSAHRVPGAIEAGSDFVSACSFFGCEATDIPEDFIISASDSSFTSICITIPANAAYLFVGPHDSLYEDNTDPNNDFALVISPIVCPSDIAPAKTPNGTVDVDDLLAVINAWGSAGGVGDIAPLCGDGSVDVDDLLAVINAWGPCE
jgi:hypothetical protein